MIPQRQHPKSTAQFPLKLTDGIAISKPILATRVGDIPCILGDTGYIVDSSSPKQLATAIDHILNHPEEAKQLGCLICQRCIQYYSLEAMAETLSSLLS